MAGAFAAAFLKRHEDLLASGRGVLRARAAMAALTAPVLAVAYVNFDVRGTLPSPLSALLSSLLSPLSALPSFPARSLSLILTLVRLPALLFPCFGPRETHVDRKSVV